MFDEPKLFGWIMPSNAKSAFKTNGFVKPDEQWWTRINTDSFRMNTGSFGMNRVGGKRSSFLPTFVFRPLTPPYVPFGIRRFLFWIPFEVRIQQTAVACSTEIIRGSSHVHNRCTTYSPITLTISPLTCVIFFDTTFHEVLYSGLGEFPSLPYTHTYSPP